MANRNRPYVERFAVSKEELELIHQKMAQLKITSKGRKGAYYRKMAIDGYILNVDYSDIKKLAAEIQKTGNNINQIAKRVNQTDRIYEKDIIEIKELMNNIWHAVRYTLLKTR